MASPAGEWRAGQGMVQLGSGESFTVNGAELLDEQGNPVSRWTPTPEQPTPEEPTPEEPTPEEPTPEQPTKEQPTPAETPAGDGDGDGENR